MVKYAQPKGLEEGIYFGLSNEAYHDDDALSHSGMVNVLISWNDFWDRSKYNPNRKQYVQTDAMAFGERCHAYLLEQEEFFDRYAVHGMSIDYANHTPVSRGDFDKIKKSIDAIRSVKQADDYFKFGYPEVSVFWRDRSTGIMLRSKIDWLRTFGWIDYKRIKAMDNWTIGRAVRDQGLDIQHFMCSEAVRQARRMLNSKAPNIKVLKGEVDLDWLMAFAADTDIMARFLFQRSTPPYIWEFRELEPSEVSEGESATHKAIIIFKKHIERYGIFEPPAGNGEVTTISTYHIPRRNYD